MLKAHDISYSVAQKTLLDRVSITIAPFKLVMVLGPNGAGKSTLLKCCSGALPVTSGNIVIDDVALVDWPLQTLAKKRAVLTQQISMPFALSVKDVVSLGLSPWGMNVQKTQQGIHDVLAQVGLPDTEQRSYASLSGGEQQRIQLARVLIQLLAGGEDLRGKYLLLDEPISALDLQQQQNMLRLLKALTKKGLGIFCVIHDINLAVLYGDSIVLMERGCVRFQGKPDELALGQSIQQTYRADLIQSTHSEHALPQWQFRQ